MYILVYSSLRITLHSLIYHQYSHLPTPLCTFPSVLPPLTYHTHVHVTKNATSLSLTRTRLSRTTDGISLVTYMYTWKDVVIAIYHDWFTSEIEASCTNCWLVLGRVPPSYHYYYHLQFVQVLRSVRVPEFNKERKTRSIVGWECHGYEVAGVQRLGMAGGKQKATHHTQQWQSNCAEESHT